MFLLFFVSNLEFRPSNYISSTVAASETCLAENVVSPEQNLFPLQGIYLKKYYIYPNRLLHRIKVHTTRGVLYHSSGLYHPGGEVF